MALTSRIAAFVVALLLMVALSSCAHALDEGGGGGFGRSTTEARITHLISEADFPAKLKDFTRFQLQKMYDGNDFSVASKKELQLALKLLKDVAKDNSRLLQKL
jgi:hypothetical protein